MRGFKAQFPNLAVMMSVCLDCFNGGLKPPNTDSPRMNGVELSSRMGASQGKPITPSPAQSGIGVTGPETRPRGAKLGRSESKTWS